MYSLLCFPLKYRTHEFFFRRTPAKVRSNLNSTALCSNAEDVEQIRLSLTACAYALLRLQPFG